MPTRGLAQWSANTGHRSPGHHLFKRQAVLIGHGEQRCSVA